MCSKWITDRRPTKDDCNKYTDGVLAWNKDGSVVIAWHDKIEPEQPWMPLPEPYVPPVDISLAASIERMSSWHRDDEQAEEYAGMEGTNLFADDIERIIEAAKKWILEKNWLVSS